MNDGTSSALGILLLVVILIGSSVIGYSIAQDNQRADQEQCYNLSSQFEVDAKYHDNACWLEF